MEGNKKVPECLLHASRDAIKEGKANKSKIKCNQN